MAIREQIAEKVLEIRNESIKIGKQGGGAMTSLKDFTNQILAIEVEIECPVCKGTGLRESHRLEVVKGEIKKVPSQYECRRPKCIKGKIKMSLGDLLKKGGE